MEKQYDVAMPLNIDPPNEQLAEYYHQIREALVRQKDFTLVTVSGIFDDATEMEAYQSAKIAVALLGRGQIDTITRSTNCLCLYPHDKSIVNGWIDGYRVGVHLDTFCSIPELVEMIRYYLRNDQAAARIVENAKRLHKFH